MSDITVDPAVHTVDDPAARSVREIVEEFAGALACSALDRLERLLDEEVAVRTPGRSRLAGDHRGRGAALAALSAAPADHVRLTGTRVTEILVDGACGLVVLEITGSEGAGEFRFEVAFHLVVEQGRIVGVTEYSGDQYVADRLLGAADATDRLDRPVPADSTSPGSPRRRWWRR